MSVKVCRLSNNVKLPVIFNTEGLPYFLTFTYTLLSLRGKAFKTKQRYLTAIAMIYDFFESKEINIENVLINRQHRYFLDKYLDELIAAKDLYNKPDLIHPIQNFLLWALSRYSKDPQYKSALNQKFSLLPTKRININRANFKSLSQSEISLIDNCLSSPTINPFQPRVRYRNRLIVDVLIHTGLRLGELLKLKVDDIINNENRYYIRITDRRNDEEDKRLIEPSNKNHFSFRHVSISLTLYNMVHEYIMNHRRPIRLSKKMKMNHAYLFVSDRGTPMSILSIQHVLSKIQKAVRNNNGIIDFVVTPHSLRHTFANNFLHFLIEIQKLDMENAKDELRMICGWSPSSNMPQRYANQYINSMANSHNEERIKKAFYEK